MTHRAGVLGSPIAHSLSPTLHRAGYAALGLTDWSYAATQVEAAELAGYVAGLDDSWRGLSLTMPLKEAAFEVTTTVTDVAQQARAINTLVRRADGGWDATNTDVTGIVAAVRHVDHAGRGRILGSGATARSALLALVELGVTQVTIAARNAGAVAELVELGESLGVGVSSGPLEEWADDPVRLVISTVPPAASAHVSGVLGESGSWFAGMTLLDVVYADWPTPLARAVLAHGGAVVSGLDMLVHQAAEQFRLFTGHPAPLSAMFASVADRR